MNRKELLVAIKELNQDEKLLARIGEKKITVIGKGSKNEDLIENFKRVMIKLDDAGLTDEVSEDCIDFFEENLDEFMPKKDTEEKKSVEENPENPEGESVEDVKEDKDEKALEEKPEKSIVMEFLSGLVAQGKYTRKEVIERALTQFPGKSKNYFGTYLSDGKNPKYNKFGLLIVVDEEGVLSFEK